MTPMQQIITVIMIALATIITRFTPFIIFKEGKTPEYVQYLGKVLPAAVFSLLVVYYLKGISLTVFPFGLAEFISIAVVVGIHLWKRQTLLSIAIGTVCYMIMVQGIFV